MAKDTTTQEPQAEPMFGKAPWGDVTETACTAYNDARDAEAEASKAADDVRKEKGTQALKIKALLNLAKAAGICRNLSNRSKEQKAFRAGVKGHSAFDGQPDTAARELKYAFKVHDKWTAVALKAEGFATVDAMLDAKAKDAKTVSAFRKAVRCADDEKQVAKSQLGSSVKKCEKLGVFKSKADMLKYVGDSWDAGKIERENKEAKAKATKAAAKAAKN